ncbi:hypothetical protein NQ317_003999 [Molorchus minor]|uniref:Uncharacterized protein n=1 Tax=Molorchus minor TaxID=1323400 RepID=A0ABQ9IYB4_9CUCU|nr:hypothetical protein NQ317_003999 [Molorchus minor]
MAVTLLASKPTDWCFFYLCGIQDSTNSSKTWCDMSYQYAYFASYVPHILRVLLMQLLNTQPVDPITQVVGWKIPK